MDVVARQTFRLSVRVAFFLCLIVVLSFALTPHMLESPSLGGDKGQHFLAFLFLSSLAGLGWPSYLRQAGFALLLLGGVIEILQGTDFIGRDMSALDWLADMLGVGVGVIMASVAMRRSTILNES